MVKLVNTHVLHGTAAALLASPALLALVDGIMPDNTGLDYNPTFELLSQLSATHTLNPVSTQALCEGFCQLEVYPLELGNPNDFSAGATYTYGYLHVQRLNDNGVPEQYSVELWHSGLSGGPLEFVVFGGPGAVQVSHPYPKGAYAPAPAMAEQQQAACMAELGRALTEFSTTLVLCQYSYGAE